METAVYEMPVSGMTCRPCEDTILEAVLAAPGVLRAEVSYWKSLRPLQRWQRRFSCRYCHCLPFRRCSAARRCCFCCWWV